MNLIYLITAIVSSILIPIGIYWMLSRSYVKILIGISVMGHGVNLFILCCGRILSNKSPFMQFVQEFVQVLEKFGYQSESKAISSASILANPLPQALILTAIVIGLAIFIVTTIVIKSNSKK